MGLRGAVSASLFGRDVETACVREIVDAARHGESRTLLVAGAAGVGKTSLVRRVVDEATDEGVLVLWGAGLPMTTLASPFRTARGMLRDLPEDVRPAPVGLSGTGGSVGVDPVELDAWLDLVARERPVVLVADDLQWVDQESLDVLRYIVAGTRERAVAVILTLRSEEVRVGHALHRWLGHVRRLPGFEALDLAPLDRYSTGELITAVLGRRPHESLVDEVFRRSDGVPYLSRLLVTGLAPDSQALSAEAPAGLEDAVLATWHGLSPGARELTTVLAVAGRALARSDLAALVEGRLDSVEVPRWLAEAVDEAVLDVDEHGRYWFHHPLQAELLEANAHPEDRRAWHERDAILIRSLLEREGSPRDVARVVAVADHYAAAGMAAEAYAWSLRVADDLEEHASLPDVVRALRRALELRQAAGADDPPVEDLLVGLRSATARAGDLWGELDAVERLLAVTQESKRPQVAAELLVRRAQLRFFCRKSMYQVADAEKAVALSKRRPQTWQNALALAHVAMALENQTREGEGYERAASHARDAMRVAEKSGSHLAMAHTLGTSAIFAIDDGDLTSARDYASRALQEAKQSGDYWAITFCAGMQCNAEGLVHGRGIRDLLAQARSDLEGLGAPHSWVATLSQYVARAALDVGDLERTREMVRYVLGADPGPFADEGIRVVAARLAALTGRPDEARQHWARVEELVEQHFPHFGDDTVYAEVLLATGEARQALDLCLQVMRAGADFVTMAEWLLPLAAGALADLDASAAEIEELEREFPPSTPDGLVPSPIPVDGVMAEPRYRSQHEAFEDWYRAELARGRRTADAPGLWEQAALAMDAVGLPWEAAYAWMRWGQAHLTAQQVDRRAAARALRGAKERATPLEAAPVLDEVEALARAARIDLNTPKKAATGARSSNLTPRETEILGHLEVGRTYAEIAKELFLSEKTVSSHISNMLRKTGAANRHDLVARTRDTREISG